VVLVYVAEVVTAVVPPFATEPAKVQEYPEQFCDPVASRLILNAVEGSTVPTKLGTTIVPGAEWITEKRAAASAVTLRRVWQAVHFAVSAGLTPANVWQSSHAVGVPVVCLWFNVAMVLTEPGPDAWHAEQSATAADGNAGVVTPAATGPAGAWQTTHEPS